MANWWDDAPIVSAAPAPAPAAASGGNWWDAAPVVTAAPAAKPLTVTPQAGGDYTPGDEFAAYGQSSLAKDPNEGAHDVALAANGASLGLGPRIAAAGDTAVNTARGWLGYAPMDGTSPDYAGNLDRYRDLVKDARDAHPVAAPVIEGVAGLATPIGVAGDALKAATLAGKVVRGAATGAGIGAIQGAGNAPDWTDAQGTAASVAHDAEIGAGFGFGLPLLGAAAGAGYRALAPMVSAPLPGAGRVASGLVQGLITPKVAARLDGLGPGAILADGSPSLTGLAGGVVVKPGAGADTLVDTLGARHAGQSDRLMADRNGALGPAVSPLAYKAEIDARQAATGPAFEQALAGMGPVDISPVVAQVGQRMNTAVGPQQAALTDLRGMLMRDAAPAAGGVPVPVPISDPRTIQNAKQAIDHEISYGASPFAQPSSAAKAAENAYRQARGGLNDALEAASPDYAAANWTYAEAARDQRAFETGRGALANAEEWPRDLSVRWDATPAAQQAAERAGVRSDVEQRFGTGRHDLNVLAQVLGDGNDFNRAKLGTYFGDVQRDAMVKALDRERAFANTNTKVVANSQSAQRLGGSKLIEDNAKGGEAMFPKDLTIPGIVANLGEAAVRKGFGAVASRTGGSTREEIGRLLSLSGPELQAVLKTAQARGTAPTASASALAAALAAPATTRALLAGRQATQ